MRVTRRLSSAALALALLFGVGVSPAGADSLDDLRARTKAAEQRKAEQDAALEQLSADLEDTDREMGEAYLRLQEVQAQLPVAQAALDEAEAELAKAQREADALAERLQDAQDQEAELVTRIADDEAAAQDTRDSIAELARAAYRGQGNPDGMSMVMGASSAQDFVQQYSLSQTAIRTQTNSLDDLQQSEATSRNSQARLVAVRETITDLKAQADAAVVTATEARATAEARRTEVEDLIAEQTRTTQLIEDRKAQQLAQKDEAASASAELADEIQNLIGLTEAEKTRLREAEAERQRLAEEEAKRQQAANPPSQGSTTPAPIVTQPSTPSTSVGRGALNYPTANVHITSSYGYRLHPILGYVRLHAGTDFRAYCGTPILASASGTVQWAKFRSGLGNQVLIDHGRVNGSSLMTSYNHLSQFAVSAGQYVQQGDVVGYSGNTGTSSACHLHFEVYVNGSTVDPMSIL